MNNFPGTFERPKVPKNRRAGDLLRRAHMDTLRYKIPGPIRFNEFIPRDSFPDLSSISFRPLSIVYHSGSTSATSSSSSATHHLPSDGKDTSRSKARMHQTGMYSCLLAARRIGRLPLFAQSRQILLFGQYRAQTA